MKSENDNFWKNFTSFPHLTQLPKPSVWGEGYIYIHTLSLSYFSIFIYLTYLQNIFTITWAYKWLCQKYLNVNWMPTQSWLSHKNQPWCILKILCNTNHIINMQRSYIKSWMQQTKYGWNTRTNQVAVHQKHFAKVK